MAAETHERTGRAVRGCSAFALLAFVEFPWALRPIKGDHEDVLPSALAIVRECISDARSRGLAFPVELMNPIARPSIGDELVVVLALVVAMGAALLLVAPGRLMRVRLAGGLAALASASVLGLVARFLPGEHPFFVRPFVLLPLLIGGFVALVIMTRPSSAPLAGILAGCAAIICCVVADCDRGGPGGIVAYGTVATVLALAAAFWLECCRFDPEPPNDTKEA